MAYMCLRNNILCWLLLAAMSLGTGGCADDNRYGDGNRSDGQLRSVYVSATQDYTAAQADMVTRTFIGGESLDRTMWSERDEIGLYWRRSGSADALAGQSFRCYRPSGGTALFTAQVPEMTDGTYDYYAAYPVPERTEGTTAFYTLPAEQDGLYGGAGNLDLMVAGPVSGGALTSQEGEVALDFVHKMHVMRVQVPTGRNTWGADIGALRVKFPSDVVGTVALDMAVPGAAPVLTGGGRTVTARLATPLRESEEDSAGGSYVWIFLCPGHVSGSVEFTAYDVNGYQSHTVSVAMDKELEAGRITPVNLTVPGELPVSWIEFSVADNNLGEEPQYITVQAPDGGRFRNGQEKVTFAVDGSNLYRFGYYAEYDGVDNASILAGAPFTFIYESEHAIVSEQRSIGPLEQGDTTVVAVTVPYLFEEDFSGASGGEEEGPVMLDGYGLAGWSGARFGLQAGTAARIEAYLASSVLTNPDGGDNKRGRLDTPCMSALKEGTVVNLAVSFDMGGTMVTGVNFLGQAKAYSQYEFGGSTAEGAVNYTEAISGNVINPPEDAGTDGSYTSLSLHKEVEVPDCTAATRLAWRTSFRVETAGLSTITAKSMYVYIDNIKVSIKR